MKNKIVDCHCIEVESRMMRNYSAQQTLWRSNY
jgi:hypothetical protein